MRKVWESHMDQLMHYGVLKGLFIGNLTDIDKYRIVPEIRDAVVLVCRRSSAMRHLAGRGKDFPGSQKHSRLGNGEPA